MRIQTTRVYKEVDTAVGKGYNVISAQGSSRSSKTYNIMIFLIVVCLRYSGTRLSVVRKTLPAIKGSVFVDFKEIMTRMGLFERKRLNKAEMVYEFANGSWVEFFSTDDEQKLRGRKRSVLFVNEANELSFLEWEQLKMRTTWFSILDYNPSYSDEHWLCALNREPKTYHFITTYKDNPFLEQAIIDEIESLKWKNPSLWRIYGLGLQAIVEGLVFTNVEETRSIPPHVRKRWIGIDFGYTNDPTAICEVGLDGNDLYVDELCYRTHMLTSDIIHELKMHPGLEVISESADPRLVEEIYRAGINIHPVQKFKGSVEAGITKMLEYSIKVTSGSANVRKEFRNYTYAQDKEGKWLNVPIDSFNHGIDAVRYVVISRLLGGKRRPVDLRRIEGMIY